MYTFALQRYVDEIFQFKFRQSLHNELLLNTMVTYVMNEQNS